MFSENPGFLQYFFGHSMSTNCISGYLSVYLSPDRNYNDGLTGLQTHPSPIGAPLERQNITGTLY
jgi:hypothetical protein